MKCGIEEWPEGQQEFSGNAREDCRIGVLGLMKDNLLPKSLGRPTIWYVIRFILLFTRLEGVTNAQRAN